MCADSFCELWQSVLWEQQNFNIRHSEFLSAPQTVSNEFPEGHIFFRFLKFAFALTEVDVTPLKSSVNDRGGDTLNTAFSA